LPTDIDLVHKPYRIASDASDNGIGSMDLLQWCTTFFGRGPQIDLLNPSGSKQVSQPMLHECL